MAQRLSVLAVVEDLGQVLSTHKVIHNSHQLHFQAAKLPLVAYLDTRQDCESETYMQAKLPYT